MDVLDLARWQFAVTTIYHFFFVPISIGLSALVAGLNTAWVLRGHRPGGERYLRLTKFFGKLLIINFAMGIVTGLVQEFQFGMNWSAYSRFVGDVFGVPLALEGLLAFFLEATFLGLWVFGWNRLPRWAHLGCIWLVAIGTQISAYVILSINAWMQAPTGHRIVDGRAELVDFGAMLFSEKAIAAGLHVAVASLLTGAALVAGVSFWHLARRRTSEPDRAAFRTAATLGTTVVLLCTPGFVLTGDHQMKLMVEAQPMKVAAGEGLYQSSEPAPFSVVRMPGEDGASLEVPYLLSWLATGDPAGRVRGIEDLQDSYAQQYGPANYVPNVPLTYWSFRGMIAAGGLAALGALVGLWLVRRHPERLRIRSVAYAAIALPFVPLAANTFGWLFTETGRQPWLAFGLFRTEAGVSPETTAAEVAFSLAVFALLYTALAVVELGLMRRAIRTLPPAVEAAPPDVHRPAMAY